VQNSAGKGILFGFVGPSPSGNVISAQSSAVVLIYFLYGCYSLPTSVKASVIAFLSASPVVAALATTISSRLTLNPTAIHDGDAQIAQAIKAAYAGLGGKAPGSEQVDKTGSIAAKTTGAPIQVLVQPGSSQSGFQVLQGATTGSLIGQNSYRRPCEMFLYKVGEVSSAGVTTAISPAQLVGPSVSVPGTTALSIGTTLTGLFSGKTAFTPVTSPPLTLALDSGQSQTKYEVVVLFASASSVKPSFYSEPRYAAELPVWQIEQRNLNLYSFFIDLVLAGMLEILGVRDVLATETQLRSIAASIAAIEDTAWQEIVTSVQYGAFGPQLQTAIGIAISSDIVSLKIRASFAPLVELVAQRKVFLTKTIPSAAFTMVKGAYAIAGVILGAGDAAAVISDVASSDQGDLWTATVTQPTVHLNPSTVTIVPGVTAPTAFTASLPPGTTGTFVWTWTLNGAVAAQISDELGHTGTTLNQISASVVYLQSTPSDINDMTLTVQGFEVGTSGATTPIGTGKASITVNPQTTGIPKKLIVLTFKDGVTVGFSAFKPNTAVKSFAWSGPGGYKGGVYESDLAAGGVPILNPGNNWNDGESNKFYPTTSFTEGGFCYNLGNGYVGFNFYALTGDTVANETAYLQQTFAQAGPISINILP
jgi:hypothetical protein